MKLQTHKRKSLIGILLASVFWLSVTLVISADAPAHPDATPVPMKDMVYLPVILEQPASRPPNPTPTPNPTPIPTTTPPASSMVYYISSSGDDRSSGLSEAQPWASFDHAWNYLYPGDTLVLLDGVYHQSLNPNKRNGRPDKPITIRAKNDGQAVIDGDKQRIPVKLGDTWTGESGENPVGSYFVIEGIIARNSADTVWDIWGSHNVIRRVSGYNANTDTNSHVFTFSASQDNLLEDCVAAGTGRKMVLVWNGTNNVVRRCFAAWQQWDGRDFGVCWPWGDGIEIYNADNNTIENSIAYASNPTNQISLLAQGDGEHATGNKILGTMAIRSGMKEDGTPMIWGDNRPQPTNETCVRNWSWPGNRNGFNVYEGHAELRDNLWQDIFAWGAAGQGLEWETDCGGSDGCGGHPNTGNNRINRATIYNNGLDNPDGAWPGENGGKQTDALQGNLNRFAGITDSRIDKIFIDWPNYPNGARNLTSMNGEGARLANRYVNGVLTDEPLWPWPMEERIKNELGYSVTDMMTKLIFGTSDLHKIYP